MILFNRRARAAALAAIAAVPLMATSASAAPDRTANLAKYSDTGYLNTALGLSSSETNAAIESVTLDRFQWILQQPGQFAILIGDPATDAGFAARAQDVEAAADAANLKTIYWFNPNLSGNAVVGATTQPNLDIRKPDGITSLHTESRKVLSNSWLNLVGKYLGNGVTVTGSGSSTSGAVGTGEVNDGGNTEVGNPGGGAAYDYSSATPGDVDHSYFLIYDKDRTTGGGATKAKIAAWVDLNGKTSVAARADVTTAVGVIGASNLDAISEFDWWRSANNAKHLAAGPSAVQGADVPLLTDADNQAADGGWRVHQVTYPELVYLLKSQTAKQQVFLFGGTWCPNTRPVLGFANEYAQDNDTTIINWDTILDGGVIGANSGASPLQSRNHAEYDPPGAETVRANANPSYLYGSLVDQYFTNIKTQYVKTTNSSVRYYPGGDTGATVIQTSKLQVPFLLSYQGEAGNDPIAGVKRQWLYENTNGTFTEYMSQWYWTNPQANQINLSGIPQNATIWNKINAQIAAFTWQTDPAALSANTAIYTDAGEYLVDTDTAKLTYTGAVPSVTNVAAAVTGTIDISPASLSAALAALGSDAPADAAAAKAKLIEAKNANSSKLADFEKVFAAWTIVTNRKNSINSAWGTAGNPNSVAGGVAAVRALDRFFGGLPGGVVSKRVVTADAVQVGTAPKITIAISNEFDRNPTGNVSLSVKQGGTTVATGSRAVAGGEASFTLPLLPAGSYAFTLSYAGDDQIATFAEDGSLTVTAGPTPAATPAPTATPKPITAPAVKLTAGKLTGSVTKAPTSKKPGKYKVTIAAAKGGAAATGKVTVTLKKGKTTKTLTGTVKNGVVSITVPKLAKGTWKATITWAGDSNYLSAKSAGAAIKVKK